MKKTVRLKHYVVSQSNRGARAGGWETNASWPKLGEPHPLCQPGEQMQIVCHAEGCEQTITLRLLTPAERKVLFRRRAKRWAIKFLVAYALLALGGTLIALLSHEYTAAGIIGAIMNISGLIMNLRLLREIIFERTARVDITPKTGPSHDRIEGSWVVHEAKLLSR